MWMGYEGVMDGVLAKVSLSRCMLMAKEGCERKL